MIAALPEFALFPIFGRPGAAGDEDSELASRLPRDGESGLGGLDWLVSPEGWGASEWDLALPSCPCAFASACLVSATGGGDENDDRADLCGCCCSVPSIHGLTGLKSISSISVPGLDIQGPEFG